MEFHAWWENLGVAPCYRNYPLAFRLKGQAGAFTIKNNADIRQWLPGDIFQDSEIFIPADIPLGEYDIQIAMLSQESDEPIIRFAIEGREDDGWYTLGKVEMQDKEEPQTFAKELYYE